MNSNMENNFEKVSKWFKQNCTCHLDNSDDGMFNSIIQKVVGDFDVEDFYDFCYENDIQCDVSCKTLHFFDLLEVQVIIKK